MFFLVRNAVDKELEAVDVGMSQDGYPESRPDTRQDERIVAAIESCYTYYVAVDTLSEMRQLWEYARMHLNAKPDWYTGQVEKMIQKKSNTPAGLFTV